jgi:hypothetical protein
MTKRQLPDDPAELGRLVAELYRRLSEGSRGAFFFPPIAGVCMDLAYERFSAVMKDARGATEEDAIGFYSLAHESVHLAQVVTSGWLFGYVQQLTSLLLQVGHALNTTGTPSAGWNKARDAFRQLQSDLTRETDGYSPLDVIETQAVVEGFWGAAVNPVPSEIVRVALRHHGADRVAYRRILERMVATYGPEVAVHLTPRLCAIALQADQPGGVMADMLRELEKQQAHVQQIVAAPLERLLDGTVGEKRLRAFTRSARERGGAGDARGPDQIWSHGIMGQYFDRFESLADDDRLEIMMHPGRPKAGAAVFKPMYALFSDGRICDPQNSSRNPTDFATWVLIGLGLLDSQDRLRED